MPCPTFQATELAGGLVRQRPTTSGGGRLVTRSGRLVTRSGRLHAGTAASSARTVPGSSGTTDVCRTTARRFCHIVVRTPSVEMS